MHFLALSGQSTYHGGGTNLSQRTEWGGGNLIRCGVGGVFYPGFLSLHSAEAGEQCAKKEVVRDLAGVLQADT